MKPLSDDAAAAEPPQPAGAEPPSYTVDEAIDAIGMGRYQRRLLAIGGFAWMADASEVLLLTFIKPAVQCEWNLSDLDGSLISSIVGLGMLIGATFWGNFADRRGRRACFLGSGLLTTTAGILAAFAPTYSWLLGARFLCGVGLGGIPATFSMVLEFLPSDQRGRWGIGLLFFWSFGGMLEAALAWAVMTSPALGWRWLVGFTAVPAAMMVLLWFWLPESPRALLAQGKREEADRILRTMASQNDMLHALPAGTLRESPAAAAALEADGHGGGKMEVGSIKAVLAPGVRWLSVLLAYVWFTGGCIYYGVILVQPDIISAEHSGERCPEYGLVTLGGPAAAETPWLSSSASNASGAAPGGDELPGSNRWCALRLTSEDYASTFVAAVGEFPGVVISLLMVDRVGRRATIGDLAGVCGAVCLLLIPCSFYWLEQVLMFVARGAANGFYQTIFVLTSELYPSTVRATAMGLGASFARVR